MGPRSNLYFTTVVAIFKVFEVKIIPTQIGGYYASKSEFNDDKNIYSYYLDPEDSKNSIIF